MRPSEVVECPKFTATTPVSFCRQMEDKETRRRGSACCRAHTRESARAQRTEVIWVVFRQWHDRRKGFPFSPGSQTSSSGAVPALRRTAPRASWIVSSGELYTLPVVNTRKSRGKPSSVLTTKPLPPLPRRAHCSTFQRKAWVSSKTCAGHRLAYQTLLPQYRPRFRFPCPTNACGSCGRASAIQTVVSM